MDDPDALAERLSAGDRRALARAITLVESTAHVAAADRLMAALTPREARRIGLSGTPGVGKSTFVEALGTRLTARGHRVAVLAVDPSSTRSGGSILGDKTRMPRLARDPSAFVRPTPSAARLGGVAPRTREVAHLCACAGFDTILVETVGVGQSETEVAGMTDAFALLLSPAGGDELQGVKRGIMEVADLVIINKADGELTAAATRTAADYAAALRLMRRRPGDPDDWPRVVTASALDGTGVEAAWDALTALIDARAASGALARTRAEQSRRWFRDALREAATARMERRLDLAALEARVAAGALAPGPAARAAVAAAWPEDAPPPAGPDTA
ncbi:MAG: methylmalonyl Co-A mutase-associated GTPase MeaB [Paracoccaceae bacterium]